MTNQNNTDNNIGKIIKITDSVIDLEFVCLPKINNLIKVKTKEGLEYNFEVLQHLTINTCRALGYEDIFGLACDDLAIDTGEQLRIPSGEDLYNKTFDSLGNCITLDSDSDSYSVTKVNIQNYTPRVEELVIAKKLLYTGMPIIDLLFPVTFNSKTAIFYSNLESNNLYYNLVNVFTRYNNNPIVFVEVAKSLRELGELSSRIRAYNLASRSIIIQSQIKQTALNRLRSVTSGIAIATNLRDVSNQDCFFFLDGGMEYLQANLEVSKLLGRELSNSLQVIAGLQEKIVSTKKANITSLQKILVPNNNYLNPMIGNFSDHFDTTLVLGSNQKINYRESYSENLATNIVGVEHMELAFEVSGILSNYHKLRNKINIVDWNDLLFDDQEELVRGKKLEDFLYSHPTLPDFDSLLNSIRDLINV